MQNQTQKDKTVMSKVIKIVLENKHIELIRDINLSFSIEFDANPISFIGKEIHTSISTLLEPHVRFFGGKTQSIFSMGAFSYCSGNIPGAIGNDGAEKIRVGRYCSIAKNISLFGDSHPLNRLSTNPFTYGARYRGLAINKFSLDFELLPHEKTYGKVEIGNDVWIGGGANIKGGIKIHDGAVIGAGAFVTKDVPPYAVVVGNPGRIVKYRFPKEIIARLLQSKWWEFNFSDFQGLNTSDVPSFLDGLSERIDKGIIHPYKPQTVEIAKSLLQI